MTARRVNILGPLVIDERWKLPRKALALIGYLAAHKGAAVSRERLADLLWPYQQSAQARHSLRNCLLEIRKGGVGEGVLLADFSHCRIIAPTDIADFEAFAGSEDIAELERVAELYRGELLHGLVIDSEGWNDWLGPERQRINDLATAALFRLAKLAGAEGDHKTAIANARRVIAIEPFCEVAHRLLMHALSAAGRSPEALRHYTVLAEVLKAELDIRPDQETDALRQRIYRRLKTEPAKAGQTEPDPPPKIQLASAPAATLQDVPEQLQAFADLALAEPVFEDRLQDLEDLPRQLQAVIAAALRIKHAIENVLRLEPRKTPALERRVA
jgi:DNA-binding SARP family transcriptional activator